MALPLTASLPQSGSIPSRWKLDEASGNRADNVGSNTLTDNNTVASATGRFSDTAADFELSNSEYLSITDASQSGLDITGSLTFSAWLKFESLPATNTNMTLASKWGSTSAEESFLLEYVDNSGTKQFRYVFEDGSGNLTIGTKNFTITTGVAYHVAIKVVPSTQTATLYINGISQGTFSNSATAASAIRNGTGAFALGARANPTNYYDGTMQDAVIWNVALTDAEATALYMSYFQIQHVASINGASGSGATISASIDVGSGSNRYVVAFVEGGGANTTDITGVTCGGIAMTKTKAYVLNQNRACYIWTLANPTAGSNSIVVSNSSGAFAAFSASCYIGVDPTIDSSGDATSAAATTITVNTTVVNTGCWLVGGCRFTGTGTVQAGTGTTKRGSSSIEMMIADSNGDVPTGSQGLTFTNDSAAVDAIVIAIKPYVAASAYNQRRMMRGFGA